MKVRIRFSEVVTYTATLDVPYPMTREEFEFADPDGGDGGWFDLLEEQHPKWVNGVGVDALAVNDRELADFDVLEGEFAKGEED